MPINDIFPKAVAFIVGIRNSRPTPIGTGFFLAVRTPEGHPLAFTDYLVTAAHVVRSEPQTWVRLERQDGTIEDLPVPQWQYHHLDDVAMAAFDPPDDLIGVIYNKTGITIPDFVDMGYEPMLGDRVHFIGLFSPITRMGERNVPLVRSGTIAAWRQEHVPVKMPDGTVLEYTAHLIDCHSYRGFSGSPVVAQYPKGAGQIHYVGVGRSDEKTALIGLVSSHFDFKENATLTGDIAGEVNVPVNLGVGVVTPAESIIELLEREDIVADRKRREADQIRRHEQEQADSAATPDSVPNEGESEFDRFEDLTQKLVNTPKSQKGKES